jgi:catechol 2,3-dioxygenase-like lactoylglutathione lyase family enzyme
MDSSAPDRSDAAAAGSGADCGVSPIESISAVTLATTDMARSLEFYVPLGFPVRHGGPGSDFTSLGAGDGFLNIQLARQWRPPSTVWGRIILWVDDVDAMYDRVCRIGGRPDAPPSDATWGERYFHVRDPDGHELSFAKLL